MLIDCIGNAWAAAGMVRVLGTIQRSQYAGALQQEQSDLASWIQEIHGGMYPHQVSTVPSARLCDSLIIDLHPSRIPVVCFTTTQTTRPRSWTRRLQRSSQVPSTGYPSYVASTRTSRKPSCRGSVCRPLPSPVPPSCSTSPPTDG